MSLIPRQDLFSNPTKASASVSPDGQSIAFLAPYEGILNLWLAPIHAMDQAVPLTRQTARNIQMFRWTYLAETLLYMLDEGGDENFGLYRVDRQGSEKLLGTKGQRAFWQQLSPHSPREILIGINDRDPSHFDYHRFDLQTKERTLVYKNTAGFAQVVFNSRYQPVAASLTTSDGAGELYLWSQERNDFQFWSSVPFDDAMSTYPLGVVDEDRQLLMSDSRQRDTAALVSIDLKTLTATTLAADDQADLGWVDFSSDMGQIYGAMFEYLKPRYVDLGANRLYSSLAEKFPGAISPLSRSADGSIFIFSNQSDDQPARVFCCFNAKEPSEGNIKFLYEPRPVLNTHRFCKMESVVVPARDRRNLVCHLSLPPEGTAPHPLVLLVHGGPWVRDSWGFNIWAQWLTNRGYAVMSVNFRGSIGFGKAHVNAGNLAWGKEMHWDLIDACDWSVRQGYIDRQKIGIMGGSYGGYAALAGLTFTPDYFACAVDIVGPSNLFTLLSTIPPYWQSMAAKFKRRVGDISTPEGQKLLAERSPVHFADKIQRPLLILQGANDPRVKQAESDQIYDAMKGHHIPIDYVIFPDEGHGFVNEKNNIAANALIEQFLARHLGGKLEPLTNEVTRSTAILKN